MRCGVAFRVNDVVSVCCEDIAVDFNVYSWCVEVRDPRSFIELYFEVKRVMPLIRGLIDLYVMYDLPQWVSTHNAMTRRLVRLKSLKRLLSSIDVEYHDVNGRGYYLSFSDLAKPLINALDTIIEVLESFKDEWHRYRDRAHRFVYPILRRVFEALREGPELYYKAWITAYPSLTFTADKHGVEMRLKAPKKWISRYLSDEEAKALFDKLIQRRLRRLTHGRPDPLSTPIPWQILEVNE